MFHQELWFAWFPVQVRTRSGHRWAWLETVLREQARTSKGSGDWRYYSAN